MRQSYKPSTSGIIPSAYFELDDTQQVTQQTVTFERPYVGRYLIISIHCLVVVGEGLTKIEIISGQYAPHSQNQIRLGPMAVTGVKRK